MNNMKKPHFCLFPLALAMAGCTTYKHPEPVQAKDALKQAMTEQNQTAPLTTLPPSVQSELLQLNRLQQPVAVPEDWLRAVAEKFLSPEEMEKIRALGSWDEIMETLNGAVILRYSYAEGVTEHTLTEDREVHRAVALLDDLRRRPGQGVGVISGLVHGDVVPGVPDGPGLNGLDRWLGLP